MTYLVSTAVKALPTDTTDIAISFLNDRFPVRLCFSNRFRCLLQVKEFQDFRRSLPEQSKIIVCKNTLMAIAADKVEGFSPLKEALAVSAISAWIEKGCWRSGSRGCRGRGAG